MVSAPATLSPDQIQRLGEAIALQGRVLATLDDWRAILFIAGLLMLLVVVVFVFLVVVLLRANRQERGDMAKERERAWGVADKFGNAAGELTTELRVQQSLSARVESALGRCEDLLGQSAVRRDRAP